MTPRIRASWWGSATPGDSTSSDEGTIAISDRKPGSRSYTAGHDGEAGGFDESLPRTEMATCAERKQTAAARGRGVHDLRSSAIPEGRVEAHPGFGARNLAGDQGSPPPTGCLTVPRAQYQRSGASQPEPTKV